MALLLHQTESLVREKGALPMRWMNRAVAIVIAIMTLALIAPSAEASRRYRYRDAPRHKGRITTAAVAGVIVGYIAGRESAKRSRDREYYDDDDRGYSESRRRVKRYRYREEYRGYRSGG